MSEQFTQNVCPQCGNVLGPTSKFCWRCGSASGVVRAYSPAPEVAVVHCAACKTEARPGKKFCHRCGAALPAVPSAFPHIEAIQPGSFAMDEVAPERGKLGRRTVTIAAGAALVFILVTGVGVIYLHQRVQNPASTTAPPSMIKPAIPAGGTVTPSPALTAIPVEAGPAATLPAASRPQKIMQAPSSPAASPERARGRIEATPERARTSPVGPPAMKQPEPEALPSPAPLPSSTQPEPEPGPVASQKPRVEILRPEPTPLPIPTPSRPSVPQLGEGPATGTLFWSGVMEKNTPIEIEGSRASAGSLRGDFLPGVPVQIEVEPSDIAIVEPPSPSNGFRRLVLRSRSKRNTVVTITWKRL
jgi:ribosomal protein L40E